MTEFSFLSELLVLDLLFHQKLLKIFTNNDKELATWQVMHEIKHEILKSTIF